MLYALALKLEEEESNNCTMVNLTKFVRFIYVVNTNLTVY